MWTRRERHIKYGRRSKYKFEELLKKMYFHVKLFKISISIHWQFIIDLQTI